VTDRVLRIVVDSSGAVRQLDELEDGLEDVEKQQRETKKSSDALGQAFRALVGFITVRELARAADSYTLVGNRIRLVTDSTQELNAVQDELFALAQRTRTDLTATADLYSRVARSTEELGVSQRETLEFTEAVNQSIQISGATAQEAAASTVQFAQGLAAGALRGDELRSVLEQNNRLARVIADEFGVSIGQLRDLGEAGELTADRIFAAVRNAGPELQAEFAQINPTLEQTLTTLGNFGTLIVGTFNEAVGVTEGLNEVFSLNEEQAEELAAEIRDLGLSFREFVEVATVAVVNFAETIGPRFQAVRAEVVKIIAAITRDEDLFRAALEGQAEFEADIEAIQAKLDAEFDAIRRNNEERRRGLEDRDADLDKPGERTAGGGEAEISEETQKLIDRQQKLVEALAQQVNAQRIANETGREYAEVLEDLQIAALGAAGGTAGFAGTAQALTDELRAAKEEAELLAAEQEELEDAQRRAAEIFEDTRTEAERYAAALAELQDLLDQGLIDPETFERAKQQLDELGEETDDFFRRARENSQDILADFFAGGFDSLDDFARAFGEMLLQLTSQALAADVLNAILGSQGSSGSSTGGLISGLIGAFGGRQFGGGVQGGQAVTTGEGGRFGSEIFVPNVSGTVMPATSGAASAAMAPPQVNLTSINTLDPSEIVGTFNDGAGDTVLLNRITTKRTAFRRALGV
jgi:tape measure domain-containing protein